MRSGGENVMTASRLMTAVEDDRRVATLDTAHLERMTLGDRRLEREVLELFLRQTTIMLGRIIDATPPLAGAAAHTLKGSARGIGAWRVARAAELLENAAAQKHDETVRCDEPMRDLTDAIEELRAASLEAGAAIGARLTTLLAEFGRQR
jgi:HPt (histidine-containing phosphotransfer) domain-containing protein